MSAASFTPAIQVCAFALGCVLIHAKRQQPEILTRLLASVALAAATAVLIAATMIWAPNSHVYPGEVATYAALAGYPLEPD